MEREEVIFYSQFMQQRNTLFYDVQVELAQSRLPLDIKGKRENVSFYKTANLSRVGGLRK